MTDIVCFKTASKMKEAGFPQPTVAKRGQFWYDTKGNVQIIHFHPTLPDGFCKDIKERGWVYIPTATDILRELPDGFFLKKTTQDYVLFGVYKENGSGLDLCAVNVNAAEAVAFIYLGGELRKIGSPIKSITFRNDGGVKIET